MVAKASKQSAGAVKGDAGRFAILLELETIGFNARESMFEAVRETLATRHVELNRFVFARNCVQGDIRACIEASLKAAKSRASVDKAQKESLELFFSRLHSSEGSVSDGFLKVIASAGRLGCKLGFASCLHADGVRVLLERINCLDHDSNFVTVSDTGKCVLSADAWLTLARRLKVSPRRCIAVGSSAVACQSALAAGMRCAAVPDAFTGFEDFAGAEYIADELNAKSVKRICGLLDQ